MLIGRSAMSIKTTQVTNVVNIVNGSHVASFKVDIAPESLAVTSQGTIIISDWGWSDSAHIVNNVGHLLHVIKPPAELQNWSPRGIACYGDIICICNKYGKSICCFSLSGAYLRPIPVVPVQVITDPVCLTFTADGKKLLVTFWSHHSSSGIIMVYRLHWKCKMLDWNKEKLKTNLGADVLALLLKYFIFPRGRGSSLLLGFYMNVNINKMFFSKWTFKSPEILQFHTISNINTPLTW